jgi:hypothetical protein
MMMMIFWGGAIGGMNLAGETEVLGGNLPRRHFVHHKIPHDDRRSPFIANLTFGNNQKSAGAKSGEYGG